MVKVNPKDQCVYATPAGLCPGKSPLHPKEHYLPAGLGNFKDDIRLNNFICFDCQKRFGSFEEVFLRNGTEAFFRRMLCIRGRKEHSQKNIFAEPTLGLPPLTVKGVHPRFKHELLWEMTSDEHALLMHQVVFLKPDGTLQHVPIRAGRLSQDLSRFGETWRTWDLLVCIADKTQELELQAILGSALQRTSEITGLEQNGEIEGEMKAQISLPYLQAVCKIAFHFVLARFHFSGLEPEFNNLKRFIYTGVGSPPAQIVDDVILPQLAPEEARLRQWSHVLTAEFNPDGFYSRLQFFAGPRLKPFVWRVNLGPNPSRLVLSETAQGYRHFYYDKPDASGYVGGIEKLRLGPKRWSRL